MNVGEVFNIFKFKVDQQSVNQVNNTVNNLRSMAMKALGMIGIGISIKELVAIADEFNQINDRINYAVGYAENMKDVQKDILAGANACKASYGSMAQSIVSLKQANENVFPIEEGRQFAEYVTKLGKSAGYSDGEISTMLNSVQRVAAAGVASAGDLNRMARMSPALIEKICEGLGVTREELDQMAASGEVTAETIKTAIINAQDSIDNSFAQLDYSIADGLLNIRNQWGFFVDDVNSTLKLTQTISQMMVKGFNVIMAGLNRAKTGIEFLAQRLGGTENLLKLILAIAGGEFVALNAGKILGFLQGVVRLINGIRASTIAALAIFILLFLIIEDFYNFMQGNDSFIGEAFKQAGIDADEMRQKIQNIGQNIIKIFQNVWRGIRAVFGPVIQFIKGMLEKAFGPDLFKGLGEGVAGVIEFIERLTGAIANNEGATSGLGKVIGVVAAGFLICRGVIGPLISIILGLVNVGGVLFGVISKLGIVFKVVGAVIGALGTPVGLAIAAVGGIIAAGILLWKNWDKIKTKAGELAQSVKDKFSEMKEAASEKLDGLKQAASEKVQSFKEAISEKLNSAKETVGPVMETVKTKVGEGMEAAKSFAVDRLGEMKAAYDEAGGGIKGAVSAAMTGAQNTFTEGYNAINTLTGGKLDEVVNLVGTKITGVRDRIQSGLDSAKSYILGLIGEALTWGSDLVGNIASGITNGIGRVTEAVQGVGAKIRSFLHFSVPDEGPLSTFESWMPDFMQGLANGINANKGLVTDAIRSLSEEMQMLANAQVVANNTANVSAGSTTNNRTVSQNVNISNTFQGDRAIQQKAAGAMKNSAKDVTSELARGLAYAR